MSTLVPIFVCVILPVTIVLIVSLVKRAEINRRAEVMIKAIENGTSIDPELLKPAKKEKSAAERLIDRLTGALVTGFMGIAFLVIGGVHCYRTPDWDFGDLPALLLLVGAILLAVGIANYIAYQTGKKILAKEGEIEEKQKEVNS